MPRIEDYPMRRVNNTSALAPAKMCGEPASESSLMSASAPAASLTLQQIGKKRNVMVTTALCKETENRRS